ncbi:DUF4115 domain-containing protein [Shewanella sp. Scap07]|uniref:RodZ domain-containing protein n=1 Tax=Shewanella sp. Scap07 TaxID=2589987 RepID=UPI0015B836F7|nr:RodZ domain-containing protein [Shewanella sp. Scap07]QLE86220.1 DUF4115 domain-containing protein [Shewanella sp. Scap07]
MTDKQIDMLDDKAEATDTLTIGEVLAAARNQKSLSIEQVAKSLNLRPGIVKGIEDNDFDDMGSTIYVKGYIKNYARLVCAEQTVVDQCVAKQFPPIADPEMQSFSRKTSRQARDGRFMLVTYLIVAILLALLVLWWVQKSNMLSGIDFSKPTVEEVAEINAQDTTDPQMPAEGMQHASITPNAFDIVEQVAAGSDATEADDAAMSNDSAVQMATQDVAAQDAAPSQQATHQDAEQSAASQIAMSDSSLGQLSLVLDGDCWIQVKDAQGKVLINDLKLAGSEHNVSGQAPFNITLGAPQVVQLKLNDQPVNLAQYPSGRVARLTLPNVQ